MYVEDGAGEVTGHYVRIHIAPDLVEDQSVVVYELHNRSDELWTRTQAIAAREPRLGSSLPAEAFTRRLSDAVGSAGVSGELAKAVAMLDSLRANLRDSAAAHQDNEQSVTDRFRRFETLDGGGSLGRLAGWTGNR